MKKKENSHKSLKMHSMFKAMMEGGYYPYYNKTHIMFSHDDNIVIVEHADGILCLRLFFSIEEEAYDLFLEASNQTMLNTFVTKPVLMDDMKTIMFSCETMCDNASEFRKFLPRAIDRLKESLYTHKSKMKKLVLASEILSKTVPATEDTVTGSRKLLS